MRKPAIASFALAALLSLIASCGGGSSGTNVISQVIATPGAPNVEPITVDTGPAALSIRAVNIPYVTIKICDPTSGACQTIDHIEVDTGSSGLRILSQALSINLQVVTSGGKAVAECTQFADGSSFGPLAKVNLTLPTSGKTASNLAIQVIGAPTYPNVPADCPGMQENTVEAFGANGILGVGPFIQDCGSLCVNAIQPGVYYTCADPASCVGAAMPTAMQVSNPVNFFAADNNGVIVELPAVSGTGAATLSGSLVFGISTLSNNSLGSASVATASADYAYVQATYKGTVFDNGAMDSGSNAVYFTDNSITACTTAVGLYCPNSTLNNLSATLKGVNSTVLTATFSVANAETELSNNPTAGVIPNIGGSIPSSVSGATSIQFDLGLPFFYGRNVFTGMEGHTAGGYAGPFYGF
jgi:Protein of unknown function (DUF3443)